MAACLGRTFSPSSSAWQHQVVSLERSFASSAPDVSLLDWKDTGDHEYHLLIGNGASMAVWSGFEYRSLFEVAKYRGKHRLSSKDIKLFDAFKTRNFEQVLASLATAERVCSALGMSSDDLPAYYQRIRDALCSAVKETHVPHVTIGNAVLSAIHDEVGRYQTVFSTNYDLLLYWAINQAPGGFKDFFWGKPFDLADTGVADPENSTQVYYLHGGLHLVRSQNGKTSKLRSEFFNNILDQFGAEPPLFISEGDHEMKLASIRSSDYLSFAFQQLMELEGKLCIFGHALGSSDSHIAEAIKASRLSEIAISLKYDLRPSDKYRIVESLTSPEREVRVWFFEAGSHPLGDQALSICG